MSTHPEHDAADQEASARTSQPGSAGDLAGPGPAAGGGDVADRVARAARLAARQDAGDAADVDHSGDVGDSAHVVDHGEAGNQGEETRQRLQPMFASVEAWVSGVFAPTYARRATTSFRWCASWWLHPEAIVRLEALWRSWEMLRLDPTTGLGTWLRDYLDPQLAALTGAGGTFSDCSPSGHFNEIPALQLVPAPPGYWDLPPVQSDAPTRRTTDVGGTTDG